LLYAAQACFWEEQEEKSAIPNKAIRTIPNIFFILLNFTGVNLLIGLKVL
jgi:hypothetical protein